MQSILRQLIVLVSDEHRDETNYRYGPGVYLTEMSPDNGELRILRNNRDGATKNPDFIRKTACYVKINKKVLPLAQKIEMQGKRNIWRNQKNVDLEHVSFYYGNTKDGEFEATFHPSRQSQQQAVQDSGEDDDDEEEEDNYLSPNFWGSTSVRPSQQQQDAQGSGVGTAIAGTAAAIAIGAAVLGLFSAYRRQNHQ